ncbi:MAG: radical SAM protein, partial [Dehalococcoidia bacterium]
LAKIPTVNLTAGCLHGCLYCYARSYRQYPGEGRIVLYENTLDLLRDELSRRRTKPERVYFSPSADLFQPAREVLELAEAIVRFLLGQGIGVSFVSKGHIPDHLLKVLCDYPDLVRAQVGIITLDEGITATFEPNAACPERRLWQLERLISAGIAAEARVDPILPTVTDGPDALDRLFAVLADVGVRRAAIDALFLRPAIAFSLRRGVHDRQALSRLLAEFPATDGSPEASQTYTRRLPRERRREMFKSVRRIAAARGIEVSVCACENPDLARGTCNLAGNRLNEGGRPQQLSLGSFDGRVWGAAFAPFRPSMLG